MIISRVATARNISSSCDPYGIRNKDLGPESRKHPTLTHDKVEFNYKLPEFLNQTKTQKNENLIEKPEAGYERRKAILDRGCSVLQTIQVSYSPISYRLYGPYQ